MALTREELERVREEGAFWAEYDQRGIAEGTMNPDLSLWEMWNRQDAAKRDECKRRAAMGDEQAALEAAFLDGKLSRWDELSEPGATR